MTKEEVTLREYMDAKFENVQKQLTGISGFVKEHYEISCKDIEKLEISYKELEEQTRFARWGQKYFGKLLILLAVFVLLIANLSIFVTLLSNSGLGEFIKIFK